MTHDELRERLLYGLSLIPERLAEYKRQKGSLIVLWKDGAIVHLTPDEYLNGLEQDRKRKAGGAQESTQGSETTRMEF